MYLLYFKTRENGTKLSIRTIPDNTSLCKSLNSLSFKIQNAEVILICLLTEKKQTEECDVLIYLLELCAANLNCSLLI